MHAEHIGGPGGEACDLVDIEGRGVGCEQRALPAHLVKLAEHPLLHVHVFESRLDDEVHIRKRLVIHRTGDQAHALLHGGLADAPAPHHAFVILGDDAEATAERCLIAVDDHHGHAGIRERHGDAAAHRARSHNAHAPDLARPHIGGNAGKFLRLALGEEHMNERLALSVGERLAEQLTLALEALLERHVEGVFNRVHAAERRVLAAQALLDPGALLVEDRRAALSLDFIGALARLGRKRTAGLGFDERDRGGKMIALRQLVDEAGLRG